jgi:bifunctional non-homologous end joining protein LigD
MGLTEYKRKRDFKKTAEPAGGKPLPRKIKGASRYVIQKHAARRLHYDFRLEMEGVLKSWALSRFRGAPGEIVARRQAPSRSRR